MTGSVADLARIAHEQTDFPKSFIDQRLRALQAAGRLRVTNGSKQPPATPRDFVTLLFGLTADKARHAPSAAADFEMLERLGGEYEPSERRAGDYLERLVARLWAGNKDGVMCTLTLWKHPTPRMDLITPEGWRTAFYPPGTIMASTGKGVVRNVIDIPIKTLAAVGGHLGFQGCNYAV